MIRLVDISLEHAADIQAMVTDPDILANTNLPEPYPRDGAESFIRETIDLRQQGTRLVFSIFDEQTLVGTIGLHNINQGVAELGYWVGKAFWGKGIGSAAIIQTVRYAFTEARVNMLTAHCLLTNRASSHILEKAGFHLTGVKPMPESKTPDQPNAFFELRREMWETGQGI